jgi:hypothetical protein
MKSGKSNKQNDQNSNPSHENGNPEQEAKVKIKIVGLIAVLSIQFSSNLIIPALIDRSRFVQPDVCFL